jgi:hypothetical protein
MADNPHFMTPEEMSKVICPFGRGNGIPGKEIVVEGQILGKPCVGDYCAAWRWASWEEPETNEWEYSEEYGFCGMVGP